MTIYMKESTIYRAFAVAFNLMALAALFAVLTGHAHHLLTIVAAAVLGVVLKDEALKSEVYAER